MGILLGDQGRTIGDNYYQFDEPSDPHRQSDTHVEARVPEVSRA